MRSPDAVEHVRELVEAGLNDCAVARVAGIPRSTVRDWRASLRWVERWTDRTPLFRPTGRALGAGRCNASGHGAHQFHELGVDYAYLFGLYLGDGCLSRHPRGVFRLRVVLDSRYPGIVRECATSMEAVLPGNRASTQKKHGANAFEIGVSSKQLPCLFPQHGPGRKHEREIRLAEWQQEIVERHPQALLRGLIHSDGCRHINTIRHPNKTYEYPRYNFTNRSDDIRHIFCDACDLLGVEWRVMNAWNISVARRASVARLDEFIGPKA